MTTTVKIKYAIVQYEKNKECEFETKKKYESEAMFIIRTLDRYKETSNISDRYRSGRPMNKSTMTLLKAV